MQTAVAFCRRCGQKAPFFSRSAGAATAYSGGPQTCTGHWALGTAFLPALPVHPTGLQHQSSFWLAGWLAACNAVGGLKLATSFQFMAKSAFRAYADCASSSLFNSKNRSLLQADCKPVKAKPL